jgi:hypothetical protein
MKKKNKLLIHFLLIFIISSLGCETTNGPGFDLSKSIYLPLKIGNKWYYNSYHTNDPFFDSTKYDRTWEVKEENFLANKLFYMIEEIGFNSDGSIFRTDTIYYGLKGDSLFRINNGQEFIPSSIQLAGLFSNDLYERFIVQPDSSGDYIGYVINKTDSTISFYYYRDRWMDSGWQMTFQKNIGYIESHSDWGLGSKLIKYEF